MDDSDSTGYWCHACVRTVNPILEIEEIKCPICQGGFVEEMASAAATPETETTHLGLGISDQDRALSLWAPILLGMMTSPRRRRQLRRAEFDDDDDSEVDFERRRNERVVAEFDQELESFLRRRRNSASIFHDIQPGMVSEFENSGRDPSERYSNINNGDNDNRRGTEHVIVINPFNRTIILDSQNRAPLSSLGDYFMGPGLDLLLQHLAENDPNRYGTPPAQKDAVEALPTMKLKETLQCSVCLDDCEIGCEVKEMPCKHKFHSGCILPWLELHSSCPICRHQLPSDESKVHTTTTTNSDGSMSNRSQEEGQSESNNSGGERRSESGRRSLPWLFGNLFSSSRSSTGNSSTRSQSRESRNARENTDDN